MGPLMDQVLQYSVSQFQPVKRSSELGRRREQHGAEACRESTDGKSFKQEDYSLKNN